MKLFGTFVRQLSTLFNLILIVWSIQKFVTSGYLYRYNTTRRNCFHNGLSIFTVTINNCLSFRFCFPTCSSSYSYSGCYPTLFTLCGSVIYMYITESLSLSLLYHYTFVDRSYPACLIDISSWHRSARINHERTAFSKLSNHMGLPA